MACVWGLMQAGVPLQGWRIQSVWQQWAAVTVAFWRATWLASIPRCDCCTLAIWCTTYHSAWEIHCSLVANWQWWKHVCALRHLLPCSYGSSGTCDLRMQAFTAAVLRNPVLDLSAMIHLSDIPDWCYIEAFGTEVCAADGTTLWTRLQSAMGRWPALLSQNKQLPLLPTHHLCMMVPMPA